MTVATQYIKNPCPGCDRCRGNAMKTKHTFGPLLLCVKCGVSHAAFHVEPSFCRPKSKSEVLSSDQQQMRWAKSMGVQPDG